MPTIKLIAVACFEAAVLAAMTLATLVAFGLAS